MTDTGRVQELIASALGGDETAQRALYEAHHARAFRLARLLLQDSRDAEEVVQDSFVYVFRNLSRYDPARGSFWTWLRVALVSRCHNKRRRRRLPQVALEVLDAGGCVLGDPKPSTAPEQILELEGTQRAVWEALQLVTPAARDALILRYYGGLPYAEIGVALGCSPEAARARVSHGKVQLRRLLTASGERVGSEGHIRRTAEAG